MHYVNPVIKDFLRTNQPEDRGSYIRLDQNENPDGLPKWIFEEAMRKITPQYFDLLSSMIIEEAEHLFVGISLPQYLNIIGFSYDSPDTLLF